MEVKFDIKSDVNISQIQYTLKLKNWTEWQIKIGIDFENPLLISQGKDRDEISIEIKDKNLFIS